MSTYDRFKERFKPGNRATQSEPFKWLCDELDRRCPEIPSPPEAHSPTDGPEEAPKENG